MANSLFYFLRGWYPQASRTFECPTTCVCTRAHTCMYRHTTPHNVRPPAPELTRPGSENPRQLIHYQPSRISPLTNPQRRRGRKKSTKLPIPTKPVKVQWTPHSSLLHLQLKSLGLRHERLKVQAERRGRSTGLRRRRERVVRIRRRGRSGRFVAHSVGCGPAEEVCGVEVHLWQVLQVQWWRFGI